MSYKLFGEFYKIFSKCEFFSTRAMSFLQQIFLILLQVNLINNQQLFFRDDCGDAPNAEMRNICQRVRIVYPKVTLQKLEIQFLAFKTQKQF